MTLPTTVPQLQRALAREKQRRAIAEQIAAYEKETAEGTQELERKVATVDVADRL